METVTLNQTPAAEQTTVGDVPTMPVMPAEPVQPEPSQQEGKEPKARRRRGVTAEMRRQFLQTISEWLKTDPDLKPAQVAKKLGVSYQSAKNYINKLKEGGENQDVNIKKPTGRTRITYLIRFNNIYESRAFTECLKAVGEAAKDNLEYNLTEIAASYLASTDDTPPEKMATLVKTLTALGRVENAKVPAFGARGPIRVRFRFTAKDNATGREINQYLASPDPSHPLAEGLEVFRKFYENAQQKRASHPRMVYHLTFNSPGDLRNFFKNIDEYSKEIDTLNSFSSFEESVYKKSLRGTRGNKSVKRRLKLYARSPQDAVHLRAALKALANGDENVDDPVVAEIVDAMRAIINLQPRARSQGYSTYSASL